MRNIQPLYVVPTVAFFKNTLLPTLEDSLGARLASVLEDVEFVAGTTDGWTSQCTIGCIFMCLYV